MSSVALIEANNRKLKLSNLYYHRRKLLKSKISDLSISFEEKFFYIHKLSKLPRNSSMTRYRRRCFVTGRPRGNYRYFGLSRSVVLSYIRSCELPGIRKFSN